MDAVEALQRDDIRQSSAYTSARFSLADPLHLILGARYTNYNIRYNPAGSPDTRKALKMT